MRIGRGVKWNGWSREQGVYWRPDDGDEAALAKKLSNGSCDAWSSAAPHSSLHLGDARTRRKGATENAGVKKRGTRLQGWKTRDWKWTTLLASVTVKILDALRTRPNPSNRVCHDLNINGAYIGSSFYQQWANPWARTREHCDRRMPAAAAAIDVKTLKLQ